MPTKGTFPFAVNSIINIFIYKEIKAQRVKLTDSI